MKLKTLSLLVAVALSVTAVSAQDFSKIETGDTNETKAAIFQLFNFESDPYCVKVRGGGTSGKALGVYRDDPKCSAEFHSKEYLELDPAVKARWALSLHDFIVRKGGGFDNYEASSLKWTQEHTDQAKNILNAPEPGKLSEDALDVTYVPYPEVESWAEAFLKTYAKDKYMKIGAVFQDWFRNDAILDGVNLWGAYESKKIIDKSGSDFLASKIWTEKSIDRYKRKVGEEGKLVGEKKPAAQ